MSKPVKKRATAAKKRVVSSNRRASKKRTVRSNIELGALHVFGILGSVALLIAGVASMSQSLDGSYPLKVTHEYQRSDFIGIPDDHMEIPKRNRKYKVVYDYEDPLTELAPKAKRIPSIMDKIKFAESAGRANAKNPNTSASGLYQFTDDTWRLVVKKWGKQHGIRMKDKNCPKAQTVMARLLADDNARIFQNLTGRKPKHAEVYAAHVLGAVGAVKLVEAQGSRKKAVTLFPREFAEKNPELFYSGDRPRTAEELYALLEDKVA